MYFILSFSFTFTFRAFSKHFCPKLLGVIHTLQSSLTCRPGESNQRPSDNKTLALPWNLCTNILYGILFCEAPGNQLLKGAMMMIVGDTIIINNTTTTNNDILYCEMLELSGTFRRGITLLFNKYLYIFFNSWGYKYSLGNYTVRILE